MASNTGSRRPRACARSTHTRFPTLISSRRRTTRTSTGTSMPILTDRNPAQACCGAEPQVETIPGPEDTNILKGLTGHIIRDQPGGGIEAYSLPSLVKTNVRASRNTDNPNAGTVHSVSGPDDKGRIAFIDN